MFAAINMFSTMSVAPPPSIQYLIVAGGGGGSNGKYTVLDGGGGGGGAVLTGTTLAATFTVTVGNGGTIGVSGGNSSIGAITASGGQVTTNAGYNGGGGGSGAGGGPSANIGGPGVVNSVALSTAGQLSGGSYYLGGGGGAAGTNWHNGISWASQASDSYSIASTALMITGVAFTFECWVYTVSYGGYYFIGNDSGPLIGYNGSTFAFAHQGAFSVSASTNPPLNQWAHIAVTRDASSNVVMYLNGVAVGSGNDSSNFTAAQSFTLNTMPFHYLTNMRFVNGSVVYPSNFTPPTSALTAIAGSTLLTFQSSTVVDNANKPSGKFSFFFTLTLAGNAFSLQSFSPLGIIAGAGGAGGLGGGGAAYASAAGANGTTGTGGGGGGGSTINSSTGGTGGSGVVVFSYPTTSRAATSYAGATYQILGSNRVYTWLTSGSFTF